MGGVCAHLVHVCVGVWAFAPRVALVCGAGGGCFCVRQGWFVERREWVVWGTSSGFSRVVGWYDGGKPGFGGVCDGISDPRDRWC